MFLEKEKEKRVGVDFFRGTFKSIVLFSEKGKKNEEEREEKENSEKKGEEKDKNK